MSSPVEFPKGWVYLDKMSSQPLYQQLIDELLKAIQLGVLPEGYKLPGTRKWAKELGINRNTLLKAMNEMEAMGWIRIYPNKGSFVTNSSFTNGFAVNQPTSTVLPLSGSFPLVKNVLIENNHEEKLPALKLGDGKRDERLLDTKIVAKYYSAQLKKKSKRETSSIYENYYLLHKIIAYIESTQHLKVKPEQIVLTGSYEMSLHLISKVLLAPTDKIASSELSSYKDNVILQSNGVEIVNVLTDENGILLSDFKEKVTQLGIKALYLNSQNQYPTTSRLNEERKTELLNFVGREKMVVIESLKDTDYYYQPRPETGLLGFASTGNLVYLGEIGKELSAGFEFSFIVGPTDFVQEIKKIDAIYHLGIESYKIKTLVDLIDQGELHRLMKKQRKIYKERRDTMGNLLLQYFGNDIEFTLPKTGFAYWVKWKVPINLFQLKKDAYQLGLGVPLICLYQHKDFQAMRIGFSELNEAEMNLVVRILFDSYMRQLT